jgi:hypothetical protein
MNAAPVTVTEVRVLERPNLCFPRPAIKIVVACPGYLSLDEATLRASGTRLGTRVVRPAAPDSEQRQRAVMRLGAQAVHRIAAGSGTTKLGVRVRTGGSRAEVVVSFPWRWRGRGLALWQCLGPALGGLLDSDEATAGGALAAAVTALTEAEQGRHYTRSKPGGHIRLWRPSDLQGSQPHRCGRLIARDLSDVLHRLRVHVRVYGSGRRASHDGAELGRPVDGIGEGCADEELAELQLAAAVMRTPVPSSMAETNASLAAP